MTRSKSLRLTFGFAALLMVVGIVLLQTLYLFVTVLPRERATLTQKAQSSAILSRDTVVAIHAQYKDAIGSKLATTMRPVAKELQSVEYFQIIEPTKGMVVYDSRSLKRSVIPEVIKDEAVLTALKAKEPKLLSGQNPSVITPYFDAQGVQTASVRYLIDYSSLSHIRSGWIIQAIVSILFFGAMAFLWSVALVQRRIITPIDEIRAGTNALISGDFNHRIHTKTENEFFSLAQSLNTMIKSLSESLKTLEEEKAWKNEFLVLASHNLRTPLTVIMTSVAALKKDSKIPEANKKYIDFIYMRGKELHTLVENLLSISMLKDVRPKIDRQPFDIMKVLNTIAKDQETRLKEHKLKIVVDSNAEVITYNGDEGQIFQVVDNCVDNAIKFTREGGTITLSIRDDKSAITLSIRDNGAGIEASMVNKLFDSFRRGSNPMSVDNKGAGLGLYFVKLAIEAHGGEVSIKSKQGEGTEITFHLPKS